MVKFVLMMGGLVELIALIEVFLIIVVEVVVLREGLESSFLLVIDLKNLILRWGEVPRASLVWASAFISRALSSIWVVALSSIWAVVFSKRHLKSELWQIEFPPIVSAWWAAHARADRLFVFGGAEPWKVNFLRAEVVAPLGRFVLMRSFVFGSFWRPLLLGALVLAVAVVLRVH